MQSNQVEIFIHLNVGLTCIIHVASQIIFMTMAGGKQSNCMKFALIIYQKCTFMYLLHLKNRIG